MLDWTQFAAAVEAPALILSGGQDGLFDAASRAGMRDTPPEARLEAFAGLRRALIWEVSEKAAAVMGELSTE